MYQISRKCKLLAKNKQKEHFLSIEKKARLDEFSKIKIVQIDATYFLIHWQ